VGLLLGGGVRQGGSNRRIGKYVRNWWRWVHKDFPGSMQSDSQAFNEATATLKDRSTDCRSI